MFQTTFIFGLRCVKHLRMDPPNPKSIVKGFASGPRGIVVESQKSSQELHPAGHPRSGKESLHYDHISCRTPAIPELEAHQSRVRKIQVTTTNSLLMTSSSSADLWSALCPGEQLFTVTPPLVLWREFVSGQVATHNHSSLLSSASCSSERLNIWRARRAHLVAHIRDDVPIIGSRECPHNFL